MRPSSRRPGREGAPAPSGPSAITIDEEPAGSEDVRWCFRQYYAELDRRFEGGFDVDGALPLGLDELTPPRGLVLIARLEGAAVGCGAVKLADERIAEIKRMWVADEVRGRGVGGRLLAELEARASAAGKSVARLETNRSLAEAIAMYRSRGYREVEPFNDERYGDHWFERDLPPRPPEERRSEVAHGRQGPRASPERANDPASWPLLRCGRP